ncbi:Ribokinase, partial [Mucuna pruriens]
MSYDSVLPLPENPIIVGFGGVGIDYLAAVPSFPKPDAKIRTTQFKVQGGGNTGNTMTCAARLGLKPRIISKVSNDAPGKAMLEELQAEGVDTSFFVVSKEGTTPFSYIIVDNQAKTRTCIFTPGDPPMVPEDLSRANLLSALDGARVVYFDARMPDSALVIAQEAFRQNIPILIDAERPREGLDDLLSLTDYVKIFHRQVTHTITSRILEYHKNLGLVSPLLACSYVVLFLDSNAWTEASSIPRALVSIILRLPRLKFVIVTLGKDGCIMLEKCVDDEGSHLEEMDIDSCLISLKGRKDDSTAMPTCIASSITKFRAEGVGSVCGRLYFGTSEKIPPSELIDTTGAGDAFVGALLYAICTNLSLEKMLPFASYVAAANCRALGARSGLPYRTDPYLASFTEPRCRISMSSDPQNAVVVGCGGVSIDFLATVAAYPKPDDKIRSTSLKVQGGGNAGNALTCLARLGLNPRLISKVADDSQGRGILDELQADGVDTSFIVVSKEGTSPFTYIIVDNQTKTRTCIHTPGYPPMIPDDLPKSSLLSALDGAKIAYFDGRLPDTALLVAHEAVRKNIPILIDAERPREGLDDLLKFSDYVVCSAKFPKAWTEASTVPQALVSMLLMLPNIKFVIVTLGKDGCIMLERSVDAGPSTEEVDVDSLLESLELKRNKSVSVPTCISSVMSTKPRILFPVL